MIFTPALPRRAGAHFYRYTMDSNFIDKLRQITGPHGVLTGADIHSRNAGFFRDDQLIADVLVRPASTEQVAAILKLCHERGQVVVAQGGRTGLVHGGDATPAELILSLERLNRIEDIDPGQRTATVQAGVTLQALQEAAAEQDLFFPLDLGARGNATVGGNVATNAGGNRVIRYGMARDTVLGVEAVLADGTIISSLNRMIKNNAGYDLKQLFIGTEGTLGIVTRVVFRLRERPLSDNLALVAVDRFSDLVAFLKFADRELGGAMSAFEVMWQDFYRLVSSAAASAPLPVGHAYYVLLESQGADRDGDHARFGQLLERALEQGLIANAALASSERERKAIWGLRDDVLQTSQHGQPFMFDVSLPLADMEAYVARVRADLRHRWPDGHVWVFGHLGDGNLHFAVRPSESGPGIQAEANAIIYAPLQAIGGSISAEHGIGQEKREYLHISRSGPEIALMKQLKQTLDPRGILNPGKVI